ncbi:MAG: toprim domain-containing protein [Pseudomonadota bacterium]
MTDLGMWRFTMPLAAASRALGGDGRSTARCPAHDDRSPSLGLKVGQKGQAVVHCYAGCDARDVLSALADQGIVTREDMAPPACRPRSDAAPPPEPELPRGDRSPEAKELWREAVPWIDDTPGEAYLRSRGLDPAYLLTDPPGWPETLRWHEGKGALLAAINDRRTTLVVGVHRIFLQTDGTPRRGRDGKKLKLSLGPVAGNAVMLSAWHDDTRRWGIAEGVESALAATQLAGFPVWAAISAGNMPKLKPPSWARSATIFADHDGPGLKAAMESAAMFRDRGLAVRIWRAATLGDDACDTLKKARDAA